MPEGTGGLAIGEGAVWALSWSKWTPMRIDPHRECRHQPAVKVKPANPLPTRTGYLRAGRGRQWRRLGVDAH